MQLQALRVVRQHVPTLPLALCTALREPVDQWAAVSADNAALCVALSIDPYLIYRIALHHDNVPLLRWALDRQLSKRNLHGQLRSAGLGTLTLLLERNEHLWHYDCGLVEALEYQRIAWRKAPVHLLVQAMIRARLPSVAVLQIMRNYWLDATPAQADYFREADEHPYRAAARLGAGLWQASDSGSVSHLLRAAVRLGRLDVVDAVLPAWQPIAASEWPDAFLGSPLDEAPTRAMRSALLARGLREGKPKNGLLPHMRRGADLELTQHMIGLRVWTEYDVLLAADRYGRVDVLEWLATHNYNFFDSLERVQLLFRDLDADDYLERAQRIGVRSTHFSRRLAWALLRRQLAPAPQLAQRVQGGAARQRERAERLITEDDGHRWLRQPTLRFPKDGHSGVFLAAPSAAWLLAQCAELRHAFPVALVAACPKPQRRALLEHALAHGLPLSAELAAAIALVGDVHLLAALRARGCPWDRHCYKTAKRYGDAALLRYLDAHEAPRRLRVGACKLDFRIESNVARFARHWPSDYVDWPTHRDALHCRFTDDWRIGYNGSGLQFDRDRPDFSISLSSMATPAYRRLQECLLQLLHAALLRRSLAQSAEQVALALEILRQ